MILDEVEHRLITPTDATTKNLLFILMYAIISSITQDFNSSRNTDWRPHPLGWGGKSALVCEAIAFF